MDSSAWIIAKKRDGGNGDPAAGVNFEILISTALQCGDHCDKGVRRSIPNGFAAKPWKQFRLAFHR